MSEYSEPTQFIDLATQQKLIRPQIEAAIMKVLDHGNYIMGPEVKELESNLKDFTQARHAITCANGTDALTLVLMAWGIGPGDAVFVPSLHMWQARKHQHSWGQLHFLLMCIQTPLI